MRLGIVGYGAGVDAVTITTPPHTRFDLVMEAIRAWFSQDSISRLLQPSP